MEGCCSITTSLLGGDCSGGKVCSDSLASATLGDCAGVTGGRSLVDVE